MLVSVLVLVLVSVFMSVLALTVVFGPWTGHVPRFFELAGNKKEATAAAEHVSQTLPFRGMLERLQPASALEPREDIHEKGGVYLYLGGPGVGAAHEDRVSARGEASTPCQQPV